jgi:hypothetical protein
MIFLLICIICIGLSIKIKRIFSWKKLSNNKAGGTGRVLRPECECHPAPFTREGRFLEKKIPMSEVISVLTRTHVDSQATEVFI